VGKNNNGNAFRTRLTPFDFISTEWNQCELMEWKPDLRKARPLRPGRALMVPAGASKIPRD
jgi:hypothetical protein